MKQVKRKESMKLKLERAKEFVKKHEVEILLGTAAVATAVIGIVAWKKGSEESLNDPVDDYIGKNPDDIFSLVIKTEKNSDYEHFFCNKDNKTPMYKVSDLNERGRELLKDGCNGEITDDSGITGVLLLLKK